MNPRRFRERLSDSRDEAVTKNCRSVIATLSLILQFDRSRCLRVSERHLGEVRWFKTAPDSWFDDKLSEIKDGMYYKSSSKGLTDSSVMPVFSKLHIPLFENTYLST